MELHALPQTERPDIALHRPAVGQQGHGLLRLVQIDQRFKHQLVEADHIALVAVDGVDLAGSGGEVADGEVSLGDQSVIHEVLLRLLREAVR